MRIAIRAALLIALLITCFWSRASISTRAASGNLHVYLPSLLSTAQPSVEQQVLDLINRQRKAQGCAPMALSAQLTAAASAHSQDMAIHDLFSHTGSDGSTMVSRVVAT